MISTFCFSGHITCAQAGEVAGRETGYDLRYGFNSLVMSHIDTKDSQAALNFWIVEIAKDAGLQAKAILYENPQQVLAEFKKGKLDLINISPLDGIRYFFGEKPIPAMTGTVQGKKTRRFLLLVRVDAKISSLRELRGKKLVVKESEAVGNLFLETLLLRHGQVRSNTFFSQIETKQKMSTAILDVFFARADACLVSDVAFSIMSELNPQVGLKLKEIAHSAEIINHLSFFRPGYNENFRERVMAAGLKLDASSRGGQILMLFKIEGVTSFDIADLDSLKNLVAEYDSYQAQD